MVQDIHDYSAKDAPKSVSEHVLCFAVAASALAVAAVVLQWIAHLT